jgi:hypothetical protein
MSVENLISVSLTEEEQGNIIKALDQMEAILKGKVINLTPEEKQLYGRVGDKTENWIEKVKMWIDQKPDTVPFYLDLPEFRRDLEYRNLMKPYLARLKMLVESMTDTSVLLGQDIYNFALSYYRNIKLVSKANVPGASEIYADLAKKFPGRSTSVPEDINPNPGLS